MAAEPILIVDDNATNAKLVSFVLARAGHPVRSAEDVATARKLIAEERPRVILMDVQLSGTDGLTFTRELKADPSMRDIVIVVLTAYAMKGDEEKAIAAGADGYVTKPIDTRTFAATVAALLKKASAAGTLG